MFNTELFNEMSKLSATSHRDILKGNNVLAKEQAQFLEDLESGKIGYYIDKSYHMCFDTHVNVMEIIWLNVTDKSCAIKIDRRLYDGDVEIYQNGKIRIASVLCGGEVVLLFYLNGGTT